MNCPCCQQPVPDGSLWWVGIHFTHSELRMMENFQRVFPRSLSTDEMLAGVNVSRKSLSAVLCRFRARIRPRGWTLINKSAPGLPGLYCLTEVA